MRVLLLAAADPEVNCSQACRLCRVLLVVTACHSLPLIDKAFWQLFLFPTVICGPQSLLVGAVCCVRLLAMLLPLLLLLLLLLVCAGTNDLLLQRIRSADPRRLPTDPVVGYAVSTTLVTVMASGLAALHIVRNIRPNLDVIAGLLSDLRGFLSQLVSVAAGGGCMICV